MFSVVLVIHLIITVALVGIILLQRSEGGGLGVGGSGNMGAMAPRGKADILTKTTAFLATGFMITSLTLVIMATTSTQNKSLVDQLSDSTPAQGGQIGADAPSEAPAETPAQPAEPAAPAVPLAK